MVAPGNLTRVHASDTCASDACVIYRHSFVETAPHTGCRPGQVVQPAMKDGRISVQCNQQAAAMRQGPATMELRNLLVQPIVPVV